MLLLLNYNLILLDLEWWHWKATLIFHSIYWHLPHCNDYVITLHLGSYAALYCIAWWKLLKCNWNVANKFVLFTAIVQYQGEKWSSQCQLRLFYSQPRQLPCHSMCPPTSPYPTIFASIKPTFKTDCVNWQTWPKSDTTKMHHQCKGLNTNTNKD